MKRVPFFTIKYSNNQNLKCFPPQVTLAVDDQHKERWSSPGAFTLLSSSQVSCGPSWSWYWCSWWWGLHMIWEFRSFPGTNGGLCILSLTHRLLRYMWEGHLGQETMEQDLEVHQGFTNWWELALLVYFSAIFIGNSTFPDIILYCSNSRNWNISTIIDRRHLFLQTMLAAFAGWAVNDLKKLNIIKSIWPFSQNIRKPKSNPNLGELHCRQSHLANSRAGESEQSPHIKVGIYLWWTLSS